MTDQEYKQLKAENDAAQKAAAEARGAKASHMKRLKEEFGLDSLAAAKQKLNALKSTVSSLEKEVDALHEAYKEEFPS